MAFEEVGARHVIDMEATNQALRPAGQVARVKKAGHHVRAGHAGSTNHSWQESSMWVTDKLSDPLFDGRRKGEIAGSQ